MGLRRHPGVLLEEVQDQQSDADGDGGIGDVERGPVIPEEREVEKIYHLAELNAVDEITNRAAEDGCDAGLSQPVIGRQTRINRAKEHERNNRRQSEEDHPEARLAARHDAERRAGIANVREMKDIGNDRDGFVQPHFIADQPLGPLVERDDRKDDCRHRRQ